MREAICSVVVLGLLGCGGCKDTKPDAADGGVTTVASTSASASASTKPSTMTGASKWVAPKVVDAGPQMPVACAAAYVDYPKNDGPKPGDDLSNAKAPMRVPAGASLTIAIRKSGHELTIFGPAIFRPCTLAEPEVVLLVSGHARNEGAVTIRPGTELFIATPSGVMVVGRAGLMLSVSASSTSWEVTDGGATFTTLDTTTSAGAGKKGSEKRFSDGGLLLTRCGVQATAVANTEKLLLSSGSGGSVASGDGGADGGGAGGGDGGGLDGGSALLASSIGTLTAESIKHAREKILDCSFAEAFGLSCDVVAKEGSPKDKAESKCKGGYDDVVTYMTKVGTPGPLLPGTPQAP